MGDSLGLGLDLSASGVYSKYSNKYIDTNESSSDDSGYMDFDSYLQLLVSQMQNQDFNDPMNDSEVLNQMAQYSMLEGIKNMTQQSNISYSTSLVGKIVTVKNSNGNYYTGKVESVTVSNGEPKLMIDGSGFDSNTVSDIVDADVYNELRKLVGCTVKAKNSDENANTAKVTDVVFNGGSGYVILDGKDVMAAEMVEVVEKSAESAASEGTAADGNDPELAVNTSEVQTYDTRSQSLIDTFMKELDAIDEANGKVKETTETSEVTEESYFLETAELNIPDYAAGIWADSSTVTGSVTLTDVDNTFGRGNGVITADGQEEFDYDPALDPDLAERTAGGNLKGVTTEPGVSTSDCVPHRLSVEKYPEEAALADKLGTRMYDIRFINNTAITSRIKTDEVIGHSSSGREVTDIGYSGVGQLGEVVTFKDGTQRVEVLLKTGNSCWYYTSGNLTLDEICTREWAPGSLTGKLTAQETAIRHFSRPMEDYDQTPLREFEKYLKTNGA